MKSGKAPRLAKGIFTSSRPTNCLITSPPSATWAANPATLGELLSAKPLPDDRYILTFDDATTDHYTAVFPLLKKYHCRASFFVPTARLDLPGYLTRAQVKELAAAGNEIGSHGHEHVRLDSLPEYEIRRQISWSQKIISDLIGAVPACLVPPGG